MENRTFDPDGVGVANGAYFGMPFDPEAAEVVLISAPWDVTVSYGAGAAYAPDAIIEASTQLDFTIRWLPASGAGALPRPTWTTRSRRSRSACGPMPRGVIDHLEGGGSPDDDHVARKLRRVNEGCAAMNANIEQQAARWLDAGKTVGLVGGDHSTPSD